MFSQPVGIRLTTKFSQPKLFYASILALVRHTPKSIFDIHDPPESQWLYQLRIGLSPIIKHNFNDILSDKWNVCKRTEILGHILLHCTRLTEARRTVYLYTDT